MPAPAIRPARSRCTGRGRRLPCPSGCGYRTVVLGPDVPVDADDVVAAQLFRVARELVVVVPLRDGIAHERRVRQREQIHHLPAHRVDPVLRNDVAREAAGAAGVDVAGKTAERIADEPQHARVVDRLREVAVAFERRRHGAAHQEGIGPRQEVQRVEEEQPVAFPVERTSPGISTGPPSVNAELS